MAPASLFHILSVVSLAVLHVSFGALPVNALALERNHAARGLGHAHADIAKRADSKKCRPRPTSVSPNAGAVATSPVPSPQSSQPAPTTTSSQSPPADTSSCSGGDRSKIIYGWSNHEEASLDQFVPSGSKGRTIFNWDLSFANAQEVFGPPSYATFQSMDYVPSVSSAKAHLLADALKESTPKYIRTYNEPNIQGQDLMSPDDGARLWIQFIKPALDSHDGLMALAPAVTGEQTGFDWLLSFNKTCNGHCDFKLLDLHFYTTNMDGFTPMLEKFHDSFNLNVWITEFGCHDYYSGDGSTTCTQEVFNTLYDSVMTYVMKHSFVEKFGWYGFFTKNELSTVQIEGVNSFMNCSAGPHCGPNELGSKFIKCH